MGFTQPLFNGSSGAGFQATNPTSGEITAGQVGQNYDQSQEALANQKNFYNALQAQGGIGNQSNVFNQQQQLANQLQLQSQGGGPNPALQQLAMTTGQNMQNQAAMMAGQRGANANAGLMARQIGQQGAGIQQQAVGQAALQRSQQQLAAQQALQNQQANMANLSTQQVGQQANALGNWNAGAQSNLFGLTNAQTNAQNNANTVNASIAKGNQGFQQGIVGGIAKAGSSLFTAPSMAQGGQVPHYDMGGNVGGPSLGVDTTMPQVQMPNAPSNQPGPKSTLGQMAQQNQGDFSGNDSAGAQSGFAVGAALGDIFASGAKQAKSMVSSFGGGSGGSDDSSSDDDKKSSGGGSSGIMSMLPMLAMAAADGGEVPDEGPISKEEADIFAKSLGQPPDEEQQIEHHDSGGMAGSAMKLLPLLAMLANKGGKIPQKPLNGELQAAQGKKVPGKPKVAGDSLKNDTVPAMLSPGEIIIPKTHSSDPERAAAFARAVVMKNRGKNG